MQKRNNKTGRFTTTTGLSRYKNVQFNNKIMSAHRREMCIALDIPEVPKGMVVHHIDNNTKNNHIDNLALVTITGHNRLHKHEVWNKGLTKKNPLWAKALEKGLRTRKDNYNKKVVEFLEYYQLNNGIKTQKDMAKELGLKYSNFRQKLSNCRRAYDKFKQK